MKISELIEQLKKYPPNMRVIIPAYESTYDDVNALYETEILLNVNPGWYFGDHEDAGSKKSDETALLLSEVPND